MEKAVVGLLRAETVPEKPGEYTEKSLAIVRTLIADAVGHVLDLPALVRGKTVLLKPNYVRPSSHNPFAIVTDERVIVATVQLLKDAGAREVWIGDNPGWGLPLKKALEQTESVRQRLEALGARIRYFDSEPRVHLDNPEAMLYSPVITPQCLHEADVYINLPKLKTHMHALVTLGIKNQYGLILDEERMFFHRNDINIKLVDILRVVKPHLTIIDGIMAVQGQAPISGSVISDMNTIVAGADVVAVDATTTRVMDIDPFEVAMIRLAHAEGLGRADEEGIEVRGMPIEAVRRKFRRPVISSIAAYPQIRCVEGGACFGCLSALRHALDKLAAEGALEGRPVQHVYVGKPMPDRPNLRKTEGRLWCFGNCAVELVHDYRQHGKVGRFVPGCPPHILDFYQAYKDAMAEEG